jgi:hypothetical protein
MRNEPLVVNPSAINVIFYLPYMLRLVWLYETRKANTFFEREKKRRTTLLWMSKK